MEERKKHQPPMSIEKQIDNLKDKGLIIENEAYAQEVLGRISYFRLVKAYSLNMKVKNGNYYDGVRFEDIVDLYSFNARFRQSLFTQIEKIEVAARCRIGNYFAETYGVLGYRDSNHFMNAEYHRRFLEDAEGEIRRNAKAPFVKNFKEHYEEGALPVYALVEVLSFGSLSKFFKNMKNEDKKSIARSFGVGYTYFESWLESIAYVRNICAHYGRVYNAKLSKTPQLYREYKGVANNRIFGVLLCMKHISGTDLHWNLFVDELALLFERYEKADCKTMGFPNDWKSLLYIE